MSFTVVVMARSQTVRTRFAMSSGLMPWYDQITPTTGILMYGKMSVAMVKIDIAPKMTMRMDITTNV